jgi:hypothetical protein
MQLKGAKSKSRIFLNLALCKLKDSEDGAGVEAAFNMTRLRNSIFEVL